MKVYLYTENFETKSFDLFVYDEGELQTITDKEATNLLGKVANYECQSDIDANGVAVDCERRHGTVIYPFKVKIDQSAPSGRGRLIWGLGEGKQPSESDVSVIIQALQALLIRCGLSIHQDRMSWLEKNLLVIRDRQHVMQCKRKTVSIILVAMVIAIVLVLVLLVFN